MVTAGKTGLASVQPCPTERQLSSIRFPIKMPAYNLIAWFEHKRPPLNQSLWPNEYPGLGHVSTFPAWARAGPPKSKDLSEQQGPYQKVHVVR